MDPHLGLTWVVWNRRSYDTRPGPFAGTSRHLYDRGRLQARPLVFDGTEPDNLGVSLRMRCAPRTPAVVFCFSGRAISARPLVFDGESLLVLWPHSPIAPLAHRGCPPFTKTDNYQGARKSGVRRRVTNTQVVAG